jgi:putative ABC transport system permease protein
MEDAEALTNTSRAPDIGLVSPFIEKMCNVVFENEKQSVDVMGMVPNIRAIVDYPIERGIYIADEDVSGANNVAVLGSVTAANLFKGGVDPLGKDIRVDGRIFEVVGVLEAKGGFIASADDFIMVPITTMQTKMLGDVTGTVGRPVQTIAVRAVSPDKVGSAKDQAIQVLRQRHHLHEGEENDFTVWDMREISKQMEQAMDIFQLFLIAVGAISLVVGGIGIMNIMLVSVSERTREIGIRRAVGAHQRDIMRQFLIESAVLSLAGGIIGTLFAFLNILMVSGVKIGGYTVQVPFSLDIVLIAMLVSIGIGIGSGFYPAYRAARMDPVESLRFQ